MLFPLLIWLKANELRAVGWKMLYSRGLPCLLKITCELLYLKLSPLKTYCRSPLPLDSWVMRFLGRKTFFAIPVNRLREMGNHERGRVCARSSILMVLASGEIHILVKSQAAYRHALQDGEGSCSWPSYIHECCGSRCRREDMRCSAGST